MSLFGQLHLGLGGLRAHQYGLEMTGDNIANVNTPGFSRRRLALSHARPLRVTPVGEIGGGVEAGPITSVRDRFLDSRHRLESSVASADDARHRLLGSVEGVFVEDGGFGFQEELSAMFNAFSDLGSEPESSVFRDQVLSKAQSLIDRMQGGHERLSQIARTIDQDTIRLTAQANDLMERIASLNEQISAIEATIPANAERDARDQALLELSELIEVSSYENEDGSATVTLRDGSSLVVGNQSFALNAVPTPPDGRTSLMLGATDVTSLVGSGEIGGMLSVRSQEIPAHQLALDDLALEMTSRVNTLHRAGYAMDGTTTNVDFFVPFTPVAPGNPQGATMAMSINPTVAADGSAIAAAGAAGAIGDGDQALAIADLASSQTMNGGTATFSEFYSGFVFTLGSDVRRAEASATASSAVAEQVGLQKLEVSAVSLDEEAVALVQYQRGYEASARFIRVVDELTELVMTIGA